jgi:hypothetical protein
MISRFLLENHCAGIFRASILSTIFVANKGRSLLIPSTSKLVIFWRLWNIFDGVLE